MKKHPLFADWVASIAGNGDEITKFLHDGISMAGYSNTIRWLRILSWKILGGTYCPERNLVGAKVTLDKLLEALHILKARPGVIESSDFCVKVLYKDINGLVYTMSAVSRQPPQLTIFTLPYHPIFEKLDLRVFDRQEFRNLLPKKIRTRRRIMGTFSYVTPLYPKLCNNQFGPKVTVQEMKRILNSVCICDRIKHEHPQWRNYIHPESGHILTTDLSLIEFLYGSQLRELMVFGSKFRCSVAADPKGFQTVKAVSRVASQLCREFGMDWNDPGVFLYIQAVSTNLDQQIAAYTPAEIKLSEESCGLPILTDLDSSIRSMHRDFYVSVVDKNYAKFSLTCRKYALMETLHDCLNQEYYERIRLPIKDIVSRHLAFLADKKIPLPKDLRSISRLASKKNIPKFHKPKMAHREVSSCCRTELEPLGKALSPALNAIAETRDLMWLKLFEGTGIHISGRWSASGTKDIKSHLRRMNKGLVTP